MFCESTNASRSVIGRTSSLAGVSLLLGVLALAPAADASFPGRDGDIAFASDGAIYTRDHFQIVPAILNASRPSYSPDGSKIAFVTRSSSVAGEVWIMNADGSDRHQVTSDPELETSVGFSPSGNRLVVARQGEIFTLRTDGGGLRQLTFSSDHEESPVWSPNGRFILYVRRGEDGPQLWTMRTNGSHKHRLSKLRIARVDLFPDEKKVIFELGSYGSIFTLPISGKGPPHRVFRASLSASLGAPVASPSGKRFAAVNVAPGTGYVLTWQRNGAGSQDTVRPPYEQQVSSLSWQPLP